MSNKKDEGLWDMIKTVIYAVMIAVIVRTFAYEPFNIPSGSMEPTLEIGDYLFVSKFSYGYSKHSLPFSLPLIPGRILFTEPERGDVAVFKLPSDGRTDYIKRIVGLPGDKIQVINGRLNINGAVVDRKIDGFYIDRDFPGGVRQIRQYAETLPNGVVHAIIEELGDNARLDNTDVYTVPPGHYFAMGDNRDNSEDSRVLPSVGFIPRENLVGRAEILFFSTNGAAAWWEFWKWPISIRFDRFFKDII